MKNMKKVLALITALMMVIVMCVPALAETSSNTKGSITVNGTSGQTYTIYKIADLESYSSDKKAYSYKSISAWNDFYSQQSALINVDDNGYITWIGSEDTKETDAVTFAKAALTYATTNSISGSSKTIEEGATSVTFSDLALGWYLIDSSMGALCMLDTTNDTAVVAEKNEKPGVVKTVQENSTKDYGTTNDASIGDTISYQTTITVQEGAENYVLHDKMSEGLTFNGSDEVTVKIGENKVDSEKYEIKTSDLKDGCDFEISFDDSYIAGLDKGIQIVVTYSATLNSKATVGAKDPNTNDVYLNYGDESRTAKSQTKTYTWELPIYKYTGTLDGTDEEPLAGAEFRLYRITDSSKEYAKVDNTTSKITGWTTTVNDASTIISKTSGEVKVSGLDAGIYYLEETKAPAGYNELDDPITITITSTESNGSRSVTMKQGSSDDKVNRITVQNNTGSELPSTGGIGTTIFYVIGGILVIGAAVALIVRKRMSGYEE